MREFQSHNYLNSISFCTLGVIIFISEIISMSMIVLLLIFTSWQYIRSLIKTLNIVCLVMIIITTLFNILLFRTRNIKKEILQIYKKKTAVPILLILVYVIIIIFNIFNAVYLSLTLHIVDYPEYGGRKRDQQYIDEHPEEFGPIQVKEFIIVAICPSIICVFHLLCIIISFMFRNKIIIIYNTAHEELYGNNNESKKNEKDKNNKNKRKRNSAMMVKSTDELVNYNETNNKLKDNKESILKIKGNNNQINNNDDRYEINLSKMKVKTKNVKFNDADTLNINKGENNNNHIKGYNKELPEKFFFGGKEITMNDGKQDEGNNFSKLNSMQGTITSMNFRKNK
jgi:hypothetical protein